MLRVAIVEGQALIRDSLANLLQSWPEIEICGAYGDLTEACEGVRATAPDLVLIDLDSSAGPDQDFIRWAEQCEVHSRILVLASEIAPAAVRRLLLLGARGVFLKSRAGAGLEEAIRKVAEGEVFLDPAFARLAKSPRHARGDALTAREEQVLRRICVGFGNKQVAGDLGISESAVKSTMQRLFQKFGVRSRSQLVRAALRTYPGLPK